MRTHVPQVEPDGPAQRFTPARGLREALLPPVTRRSLATSGEAGGGAAQGHAFAEVNVGAQDEPVGARRSPVRTRRPSEPRGRAIPGHPVVGLPAHIRGAESAPGTPDRIPPRVETRAAVRVLGVEGPQLVRLSVEGSGGGNGTVTIDDAPSVSINRDATLRLRGVGQTEEGKAGGLRLVADLGGARLAESEAFSVAAWPVEIGFTFGGPLNQIFDRTRIWGALYDLTFRSDSKEPTDCDRTSITENVVVQVATGAFGAGTTQSAFKGTTTEQVDRHGLGRIDAHAARTDIRRSSAPTRAEYHQFFRFACARSGIGEDRAEGPKVPVSGFKILHWVTVPPGDPRTPRRSLATQKSGFANNGVKAGTVNDTGVKLTEIVD